MYSDEEIRREWIATRRKAEQGVASQYERAALRLLERICEIPAQKQFQRY